MSTDAINWARPLPCPNPTTKLVLFMLANYANKRTHQCFPSEKHLGEICGVSDRSVRRCISALEDLGYITIRKRLGMTNLYRLSMDTSVHPTQATSVHPLRSPVSSNTLNIQNTNPPPQTRGRTKNDLAG
tara:strand:+ start:99 stop:488 length:390 start_codon:yes stop_codon:yes gene_type:complete